MKRLAVIAILTLTACGVDGPPERPAPKAEQSSGVTISGDARFGVMTEL